MAEPIKMTPKRAEIADKAEVAAEMAIDKIITMLKGNQIGGARDLTRIAAEMIAKGAILRGEATLVAEVAMTDNDRALIANLNKRLKAESGDDD